MIELGQILTGLIQRTEEGKLSWTKSVQTDRYVASVDVISLVVGEYDGKWGSPRYRLDVFDELGEVAGSFDVRDTTGEQQEQLSRLFELARRSANKIDSTLEKLAKALEI